MTQASMRLLTLLSLLQAGPHHTGAELAERLRVSRRTVRNDIDRLRECGYAVEGVKGCDGGYRLGPGGAAIPPLVLDSDEAVAVAIGLQAGVNCIIGGMEEVSLQALAKLERMLPEQARRHVRSLGHFVVPMPTENAEPVPAVDASLLTLITGACERHELLRFDYPESPPAPAARPAPAVPVPSGARPARRAVPMAPPPRFEVEPYLLINRSHRWFLLAFDPGDGEWRIFPVHGIALCMPASGGRFSPRPLPSDDMRDFVGRRLPGSDWKVQATVAVAAPAEQVRPMIAPAEGRVEPAGDQSCIVRMGGETAAAIAGVLIRLDADFLVEDPPEVARYVAGLAKRFRRGSAAPMDEISLT
ncbi:helix-turn-helix transcriptional regulator [Tomitella gaofuii]|uniref:helix-turn-helix transcriptional regulator n=1 Tax=Tomitella gaofuii TaxID=2760083 RepID=UPI0015F95CE1|nr:WYL domain-containing protein [Tomitella gaofuii]